MWVGVGTVTEVLEKWPVQSAAGPWGCLPHYEEFIGPSLPSSEALCAVLLPGLWVMQQAAGHPVPE